MADEKKKKVQYEFAGDVKSLRKATESAINLLDKYQQKMAAVSKAVVTPAKGVNKNMPKPLKTALKDITALQQKYKDLQNIKIFQNTSAATKMSEIMRNLQQQVALFQSKTKVTAADIQSLTSAVDNAKRSFADISPQISQVIEREQRFQEQLSAIKSKASSMAESMRSAFSQFLPHFDTSSAKMEAFKAKSSESLYFVRRLLESVGAQFRQFKGDSEEASNSGIAAAASFRGIAEAASKVDPKLAAVVKGFQAFLTIAKVTSKICKSLKEGFSTVQKAVKSLSGSTKELNTRTEEAKNHFKSLLALIGGWNLGTLISRATKEAIGFIENLNLFTVAMGDSVEEGLKFVDTMAEMYGMDPSNLYRYAGYFYQLTDAIGATSEASKTMSLSLTKAANDIASLFNVEIEQVVDNLASGMQGMSMAVRKYGIDIRKTTLQQTALQYGFTENVSTTSEANRQALRYLTIMQQVKNATKQVTSATNGATVVMGDFARNIETPANQLRILKEQVSQVARAFGNFLIPIMQKTLYVINGVLMALKTLLQFLASLAGIEIESFGGEVSKGADEAAKSVGGIGDAASGAAKKLKNLIAPFDELTILSQPTDTGGGGGGAGGMDLGLDPGLEEALKNMSLGLDEIRMKAMDVRDKILELLGLSLEDGEIKVIPEGFIDDLINLWNAEDYTGFGKRIAEFLNMGIAWGIEHTDPAKYAEALNRKVRILAEVLNGLIAGLNWEGLGTIIGNGITLALGMINTFLTTFDWHTLGTKLGEGLNGIVYAVDWDLLGETIGNFFMAKIRTLTGFFETFDWTGLGIRLGSGFMSLLTTIKWDEIGHMVAEKWNGVIDAVLAFFDTYEWGTIGSSLALYFSTAIREINWHNLGKAVSDVLRDLLREITNFIGEMDWFAVGKAITEFILAIDWFGLLTDLVVAIITILGAVIRALLGAIVGIFTGIGKDIVDGFQGGILEGLKNIGTWLKEHLVDPVVRAVKGFFGIHSPSTVFAEIGKFLIDGLLKGILDALRSIVTWIKTHIADPVINAVKSCFGINGSGSTIFENMGKSVVNGLMKGLQTIEDKLTTWGNNIKNSISNIFNSVKSTVSGAIGSINNAATNITNKVKNMAQNVSDNVKKAVNTSTKAASTASTKTTTTVKQTANTARKMATGGVVKGPTYALVGEGQYDEAVIPLGNSPELQEMVDKIANAVSATPHKNESEQPIEIHVYLEGTEITTWQNRTNRMYGRTQQNI